MYGSIAYLVSLGTAKQQRLPALQIEGLPVYGVAIPTVRGLRSVLDAVGAYQGEPHPAATASSSRQQSSTSNRLDNPQQSGVPLPTFSLQHAPGSKSWGGCKHTGSTTRYKQQQMFTSNCVLLPAKHKRACSICCSPSWHEIWPCTAIVADA
jgi:hypothetical protein